MRLFEKSKKLGIWNPADIDFSQDREDWAEMSEDERDFILLLTAQFLGGEEAVEHNLLPLILAISEDGRIEEEMYLSAFLWEEAKHTDFFSRALQDVLKTPHTKELQQYHHPDYRLIFYEILPRTLRALRTDPSPEALLKAAVTYNMIVEGVLAETGYHAYFTVLVQNNLMPGLCEGIRLVKQDEARHIAYGVFLISRLINENPELWPVAEEQMAALYKPALNAIKQNFLRYNPPPFKLHPYVAIRYARAQYAKRYQRIQKARDMNMQQLHHSTNTYLDEDGI